jgi:HNH endonuclease
LSDTLAGRTISSQRASRFPPTTTLQACLYLDNAYPCANCISVLRDETLEERFNRNVTRGEANECWMWRGSINIAGYGQMTWHKIKYHAHRLAYELFVGPITKRNVCHHCDRRACVNPSHLFQATQSENMLDCVAKGRISRVIADNIARTGSTPESREAARLARAERRRLGGQYDRRLGRQRDGMGRFIQPGQQFAPRRRDAMGQFL